MEKVILYILFLFKVLEFFNSSVKTVMKEYSIAHFSTPTKTPWKASIAERVIRTLKTRLWRWFQFSKSTNWMSVLSQFVENYNSTPHKSIGMAPNEVNKENQKQVRDRLFPEQAIKIECSRKVGDLVRKLRVKQKYEKGFTPKWSEEIYIISKQIQSNGVCWYRLSEQNGNVLPGIYYSHQLNLVSSEPPLLSSISKQESLSSRDSTLATTSTVMAKEKETTIDTEKKKRKQLLDTNLNNSRISYRFNDFNN